MIVSSSNVNTNILKIHIKKCRQAGIFRRKFSKCWYCLNTVSSFLCKIFLCPNVSATPLREWVLWQYLSFSWTTLRSTHCRRPIAVMGIVDTFQLYHFSIDTAIWLTFYQIILVYNHHWLNSINVLFGQHYRLKLFVQLWQILYNGPMISKWILISFSCFIVMIIQG